MELPFTTDQFLEVFRTYNLAIWPAQVVAYLLGAACLAVVAWPVQYADRLIGGFLAASWIWMGAVYHLGFFAAINPAAYAFGGLFIIQGLLFIAFGVVSPGLTFKVRRDIYGVVGAALMLYALVLYPALGVVLGHGYPYAPLFGVAPCPTTIFTFGLLLWTRGRVSAWLLVIPALWTLIGTTAAFKLGIWEDLGLLLAGVVGTLLLLYRREAMQAA